MKNKTLVIILFITLCFFLLIPSSWAGSKQRYRWEGVAIGIGATILGNVLFNHYYCSPSNPVRVYHFPPSRQLQGYWEFRKVWVPPVYKKVWNPGHFNRNGRWTPGEWIRIEKESGHWAEERIWITYRD